MPQHNILSIKVKLAEDVSKHQLISMSGHLATTGTVGKEPVGASMYEGRAGEEIAVISIGLVSAPQDGSLVLGDMVKAAAGLVVKATTKAESFATVCKVPTINSVELLIK